MKIRPILYLCVLALFSAASTGAQTSATPELPYPPSLNLSSIDKSIDPCVNLYQYSCGRWQQKNPILHCGALAYDTNSRVFSLNDGVLQLTPRERGVLEALILRMGKTVSKQSLADSLFGMGEDVAADAIEVYVHRVRKKLENCRVEIVTVRGFGYLLQEVRQPS